MGARGVLVTLLLLQCRVHPHQEVARPCAPIRPLGPTRSAARGVHAVHVHYWSAGARSPGYADEPSEAITPQQYSTHPPPEGEHQGPVMADEHLAPASFGFSESSAATRAMRIFLVRPTPS